MEENKKQNFKIVLIIVFIVIAMIIIAYCFFNYIKDKKYDSYSYKNDEMSYERFKKEYSEYSEDFDIGKNNYYQYKDDLFSMKHSSKIDVTYKIKKEDKKIYIFLVNNTELDVVDAKVGIIYYDAEGNIIDTDHRYVYRLEKGNETCQIEYIKSERIADIKIVVNAKESNRDIKIGDKIKTDIINDNDKKMKVKVTNESDYAIKSLEGEIVFYDAEDNIVSASNINFFDKIKSKKSREKEVYVYEKNYSKYKIYINNIDI